jgi:hypothetical protein
LQNPLAPAPHGVFGLKTFYRTKTVPRKSKSSADNQPPNESGLQSANGKAKRTEPKKKSTGAGGTAKRKKPAAAAAKSAAKPQETPPSKSVAEPTDEEIRIRAYFLAERRHRLSLPGDSAHDWIEARRQLIEEAKG